MSMEFLSHDEKRNMRVDAEDDIRTTYEPHVILALLYEARVLRRALQEASQNLCDYAQDQARTIHRDEVLSDLIAQAKAEIDAEAQ